MKREDIVGDALDSTKEQLAEVDREKHLTKAVKMLECVQKSISKKEERFRDWYSLHFPELVDEIEDIQTLTKILDSGIKRSEIDSFNQLAESSKGSDITEKELEIIQSVLEDLKSDLETRDELETYINNLVEEEMPNLDKVLGTFLAAKMIALAGGLDEMAKKPASTVQMLGAEKALFRHMRGNGESPKHGILFEHEYVNSLPEDQRGKMARFIANKAVMAARLDNYGDKDKGAEYREEIRQKHEELAS